MISDGKQIDDDTNIHKEGSQDKDNDKKKPKCPCPKYLIINFTDEEYLKEIKAAE